MKTKITNWIILLPIAMLVVFFGMSLQSQPRKSSQKASKIDTSPKGVELKLPDSTKTEIQGAIQSKSRVDSLASIDSVLSVKNAAGLKTIHKKKKTFEEFQADRETPVVSSIHDPTPAIIVNSPPLPDTLVVKKKVKRSVFARIFKRKAKTNGNN